MQYIIFKDNTKMNVEAVFGWENGIKIQFPETTQPQEIFSFFNSKDLEIKLSSINIYTEQDELQGEHKGFSILNNILFEEGKMSVSLSKENELKPEFRELKQEVVDANIYITDLELRLMELELAQGV